jgi:hypothetical protein
LHIRNGSIVTDSIGREYEVTSFVNNTSITVNPMGGYSFSGDVVYAPSPTFFQGKWISANDEYLLMDMDTREKTPLIWLVRGYSEKLFGSESFVKLEVRPFIYFLDDANFDDWLNDDHDVEAINPMYNLANLFVETLDDDPNFSGLDSWDIQDEPRFGVTSNSNKGNTKRILSDDLSGVRLSLPINYSGECKNC